MTAVGLITVSGLVAVLGYIVAHNTATKVKHLWGYLFCLLVLVTASFNSGLSPLGHAAAYAAPALAVAIWTVVNFRSWDGYTLASLFLMNIFGNFFGLDTFKFLTVDALDAFAWVQIGLLLSLARKTPVENAELSSVDEEHSHNDKQRLRLISGGHGDSRPARP